MPCSHHIMALALAVIGASQTCVQRVQELIKIIYFWKSSEGTVFSVSNVNLFYPGTVYTILHSTAKMAA